MDDETTTKSFEGYSDYQDVSNSIRESIDDALEAYTEIESLHAEDARVKPFQAARARSMIKLAALKIVPELRDNSPSKELYQEILARWLGGYEVETGDGHVVVSPEYPDEDVDGGYLGGLNDVQLTRACPGWLEQFAIDIRTAGWELGYLKAGRTTVESNLNPAEEEARAMFEN